MQDQKPFVAYTYTPEDKAAKRRRVVRFWILFVVAFVLFLIFGSFILWQVSPGSSWRTLVVDKTVPHPDYREHQSLFWVLNHAKVVNKGGERKWRPGKDYVGFYPEKFVASDASFSSNLESAQTIGVNLIFLADTYGVYADDYKYPEKYRTHLDYSQKIFGGLEEEEVDAIEDFVQNGGSLIAEFNSFHHPTPQPVRERIEKLLGLRSTGWMGRYFKDLANRGDVPAWALRHWKTHSGEEWNFSGPGYILAHPDTRLLVLEERKDVEADGLQIRKILSEDPLMRGAFSATPYRFWFDIEVPVEGTEVLAQYRFRLTARGREKMQEFGLPEAFPAVMRASREPLRLYFAGDFSDNNIYHGPYFFYGWSKLRRLFCCVGKNRTQNRFFWDFYVPLLENIFTLNH
jgi:hypothetical protein